MRNQLERFDEKWIPEPNTGCWLWMAATVAGYGQLRVARRAWLAHRFSWELRRGPIPAGLCALHKCDTPLCVNPDHLFLGTRADNNADRSAKGRNGPGGALLAGEKNGRARLDDSRVREIRAAAAAGAESQHALARRLGVRVQTVHDVVHRRTWRHVP